MRQRPVIVLSRFGYFLRDLGLSLVPPFTLFLTQATVSFESQSGETQMTLEWYLPH